MTPVPSVAFFSIGSGGGELLVVFIVALLVFGPRRLPEIARSIGRIIETLRKAAFDFKEQIMNIESDKNEDNLNGFQENNSKISEEKEGGGNILEG